MSSARLLPAGFRGLAPLPGKSFDVMVSKRDMALLRECGQPHAGAEPHGALQTIWVSPLAMDGLERGLPVMPHGAMVLLGEHSADSLPVALDVMIQVGGSEAEAQDWLFARLGSAGEIEPTVACANCHVSDPDWLFTAELGRPLPVDSTGAKPAAPGPS